MRRRQCVCACVCVCVRVCVCVCVRWCVCSRVRFWVATALPDRTASSTNAAVVVCRDQAARALSVSFACGTRPPGSPDRDAVYEMINDRGFRGT